MAQIFNYTDYRKFLKDRFSEIKSADRKFTYRYIASQVGFNSAGYFTQVLQSKSNLSERLILSIALLFGLKKRESRYFSMMVHYNQATTHEEKKQYFERMLGFKKGRVTTIDPDKYIFYDRWYYSAIRAVLHYHNFAGDYKKLARAIVPNITPAEARKAVRILEELHLITRNDAGRYSLTDKHITTGLNMDSVILNNFVINTLDIAKDALYRFDNEQRSYSALTLSISEQGYRLIKNRIDNFRKEIVEIVKNDSSVDRVYQINFQIFPLTPVAKTAKAEREIAHE